MNEGKYSVKISNLQTRLNNFLVINIVIMFILMIFMSQVGNRIWMRTNADVHYYIYPKSERPIDTESITMKSLMSFFLLLNATIPLDLAVSYNIIKAWYTMYLIDDYYMIDQERSEQEN